MSRNTVPDDYSEVIHQRPAQTLNTRNIKLTEYYIYSQF